MAQQADACDQSLVRFLLTGSSGDLGKALVPALKGHEVQALARNLPAPGEAGKVDVVLHMAGLRYDRARKASEFAEANVGFTERLLSWLEQSRIMPPPHFIFLSTMYVYGERSQSMLAETSEPNPRTAYGASKLAAEKKIAQACARLDIPFTILRLATVYGAGDDVLRQMERGFKKLFPFVIGDGAQERSMLSIEGFRRTILAASGNPRWFGQTVNVADSQPHRMFDLVERVAGGRRVRHLPRVLTMFSGKLARMNDSFLLDTAKLASLERD
jgi:nucleoside-diphosphate-sugar epimerase